MKKISIIPNGPWCYHALNVHAGEQLLVHGGEVRAEAIVVFFRLIIGYLIGGGVMIVGGVTELLLGVPAQQKPLEAVARPLSVAGKGPRTCRPGMDRGWRWLAVRGQPTTG